MKSTALIVDDEASGRSSLKKMIELYCPVISHIYEAETIYEAADILNNKKPQLLFLDIEMPNGNGFDLLKMFPDPSFNVIFVTAYDAYAVRAFKVNAIDYVLKPVRDEDLIRAVDRAIKTKPDRVFPELYEGILTQHHDTNIKLSIPTREGYHFTSINDIIRMEGDGNYTVIVFKDKKIVSSKTLKEYEQALSGQSFTRVHKKHLINTMHAKQLIKADGGGVLMEDGELVPISRHKRDEFLSKTILIGGDGLK